MAPFKFPPPPPPPPPKAPSNDAPNAYNGQRGGHRGGRGDSGRGRGAQGRARGNAQGNMRGGHQGDRTGGGFQHGGHRGDQQQHHGGRGGYQTYGPPDNTFQRPQPYSYSAPQTTPNPNRAPYPALPNTSTSNVLPPPLDPAAFAQAMAFMATPAGMQSMATFASHMAAGNVAPEYTQPLPFQQPQPQNQSSPQQPDSRKRKRNERAKEWQAQMGQQRSHDAQQQSQKPPRAKVVPAPPVPSFGFSLPTMPTKSPMTSSKVSGKDKTNKRKMNLGLTQMEEEPSSSEEADMDEEAILAAKVEGQGIVFEHEGEFISLQTAAEVASWIKDRKRHFPTQKRIAEKQRLAAEKRESELEFLRKVKGKSGKRKASKEQKPSDRRKKKDAKQQPAPPKPNLDELRDRVKRSMPPKELGATVSSSNKSKIPAVDLGLGYATESDSDDSSSALSDSSVVSSSGESSEGSSSGVESDNSDAPPETQNSKIPSARIVLPSPAPLPKQEAPNPDSERGSGMCTQWKETGRCKYGRNCRYRHGEVEPKFVGLYDRLVEQELEKADRLALEAIKYLGRHGYLG